jgi:hypothetical protein
VFGVLFLAGCVLFFWRRMGRPASVGHRATDWYVIISFLAIGISGYLVEGLRIIWQQPTGVAANCSPAGLWVSHWFSGMTEASARSTHQAIWWIHAVLVFGFIASVPYTRLLHIIAGPLNLFFAQPELGRMVAVSMEEVERRSVLASARRRDFQSTTIAQPRCLHGMRSLRGSVPCIRNRQAALTEKGGARPESTDGLEPQATFNTDNDGRRRGRFTSTSFA